MTSEMTTLQNFQFIGNIFPEDFKVIGFAYLAPMGIDDLTGGMDYELEYEIWEPITKDVENYIMETVGSNRGRCNHCNAHIKYLYIVKNVHTGTVHTFGSTCGVDVQNFSGFNIADAQERNMKKRKQLKRENERKQILAANPGLEDALKTEDKIIKNIAENFRTYDKISEKQIELVFKIVKQRLVWAEAKQHIPDVVEGRLKDIEFTVTGCKVVTETDLYSYNKRQITKYQLTLQHPEGWKIWGKILDHNFKSEPKAGDKIKMSVSVTKSPKDSKFGFFSRAKIN